MTEQSLTLILVAAIAATPPTLVAMFSRRAQKKDAIVIEAKVDAVHAIADGRLSEALGKIAALETIVTKQRSAETIKEAVEEAVQAAVLAAFKKNGEKTQGGRS